jgi:DNA-directed RNA polymerase subunit E'/Rpb7
MDFNKSKNNHKKKDLNKFIVKYQKQREQMSRKITPDNIFSKCMLTRSITLQVQNVGTNVKESIEEKVANEFEGKCEVEGFIKTGSTKVVSYSSGLIQRGNTVVFEVVFEAEICYPVEGTVLSCVAKNITKAGIRAESADAVPSPIVVFIAREHHNNNNSFFSSIKVDDRILVRVIGQRFELNDPFVSVIGEVIKTSTQKAKLTIED